MYCEKDQNNWDWYLPQVMMAYRASTHSSTCKSPNLMMLGREVTLPMLAVIGEPVKENVVKRMHADDYIEELQEKMKQAHKLARKYLKQNAIYQKRHYDLKAKERSFKVGQPVWLHDPVRKVGVCQKMTSPWKGPYLITRKIDDILID
jgi:hypothetical protein